MTTRLISAATAVMALALLIAGNARAQDFDPCAGLTGKAKGLCTAYSAGMGCSDDFPLADPKACTNVATMFEEVTGSPPPSDCPCDFSLDRISSLDQGWNSSEYLCHQEVPFDPEDPDAASIVLLQSLVTNDDRARVALFFDVPTELTFSCLYIAGNVEEQREGGLIVNPSIDDITARVHLFEACRGAIGILAANVTIDPNNNNCTFD